MRHLPGLLLSCLLLAGGVSAGTQQAPSQLTPSADSAALAPAAQPGRLLLLGEIHDNPAGHARRLQRLQAEMDAGWRPALVMEQFDRERAADLANAMATCRSAACVIRAAGGDGWDWRHYEPVLALALRYRLPVLPGNVSRTESLRVMRDGLASVLPDALADYLPTGELPAHIAREQEAAIIAGHCGVAPRAGMAGMVRMQVARDLWMTRQLMTRVAAGAVLLAGNGHVRRDIGVPYWLQRHAGLQVRVIATMESAATADAGSDSRYDEIDRVAAPAREDLCHLFRKPVTHD